MNKKSLIILVSAFVFVLACQFTAPPPTSTPIPLPTETATSTLTPTPSPTVTPTFTPVTQTFTVIVSATELWFNTGIKITKGQEVTIRANGIVNTWGGRKISNSDAGGQTTTPCDNEACPMSGAYYGELIGRLGVGTPFRVGSSLDFTAPGSGTLFLTINDWSFKDNSGEFSVVVTVK